MVARDSVEPRSAAVETLWSRCGAASARDPIAWRAPPSGVAATFLPSQSKIAAFGLLEQKRSSRGFIPGCLLTDFYFSWQLGQHVYFPLARIRRIDTSTYGARWVLNLKIGVDEEEALQSRRPGKLCASRAAVSDIELK